MTARRGSPTRGRSPVIIRRGTGSIRFRILARDPRWGRPLRHYFATFPPAPARATGSILYEVDGAKLSRDGVIIARCRDPIQAAGQIVMDLGEQVPARSSRHVCLHAGAVSRSGRALLLPAALKGGKSTLTLGLVRRGFSYYSDDLAIIRLRDAKICAFPRPIELRPGAIDLFPRLGPGLEVLPAGRARGTCIRVARTRTGRTPARVRWIVFPHVRLGTRTRLTPLPRAGALVRLSRLGFNLDRLGAEGFETLVSLVRGADCYALEVGRLPDGLRALSRVLSR
ncbi:MAG: hypothetical protein O7H41_09850 [Planctomycetota bacterium]|nr:hypothetical protein [Planctomycetota bacterium]